MSGVEARRLAIDVLVRIDRDGAYANLVLPAALDASRFSARDRGFVTELVYGVTRMRRALDFLVDPYVLSEPDATARAALRLGAYQLWCLRTPAHAAVGETVGASPKRVRGFVNAVLRRVAKGLDAGQPSFPDTATRLSYPDWIVERLVADLGDAAVAALEVMNDPPEVTERDDGYRQDLASQLVVELVGAEPGERVADLCAAPGGKATGMAASGALVVAGDRRRSRAGLVAANVADLGAHSVFPLVADARRPPLREASFDRVLVDAPCSGLGVLRRRPDARWRISPGDVGDLAELQIAMVLAAAPLVRPGGILVYGVCTLTTAETTAVDEAVGERRPDLEPITEAPAPWLAFGRGHRLLPQTIGSDGMTVYRYRVGTAPSTADDQPVASTP